MPCFSGHDVSNELLSFQISNKMDRVQSLTTASLHPNETFHPEEALAGAAASDKALTDYATKRARSKVSTTELIQFAAQTTKLLALAVRVSAAADAVTQE